MTLLLAIIVTIVGFTYTAYMKNHYGLIITSVQIASLILMLFELKLLSIIVYLISIKLCIIYFIKLKKSSLASNVTIIVVSMGVYSVFQLFHLPFYIFISLLPFISLILVLRMVINFREYKNEWGFLLIYISEIIYSCTATSMNIL